MPRSLQPTSSTTDARRRAWIAFGLVALAAAVYAPVRAFDFVSFDDQSYVNANPHVLAGLTWDSVRWAFTRAHASNWHPLTWLSHMLDVQLFGIDAGAHHVVNAVIHAANGLLLFDVLRRATGALGRSAFVAALFVAHPLHVESVAWVAERKDVLSTLFWMLTLEAYVVWVRDPRPRRFALVLAAYAAGLMAKPMLVTLPFALLLLDWWPLARLASIADLRARFREKTPLFALAAASSVVTFFVQREAMGDFERYPLVERVGNALVAYVLYVRDMIWPASLTVLYVHEKAMPLWKPALAAALLVTATFVAVRQARRRPWCVVGWFWFLGTLVPVIGLVQVGLQARADRYTYVPLIGLFVVVAWTAAEIAGPRGRRALAALGVAATLVCAALARRQVETWRDSETLWRRAVAVDPENAAARNNLGDYLCWRGRFDEAIAEFREMVRIAPASAEAHNNLGYALRVHGDLDAAIDEYREALRVNPKFAEACDNWGLALRQQGLREEAAARFADALRLRPDYADAHHNLGVTFAELGRTDDAVRELVEATRLAPDDAPTHVDLGMLLGRRGDAAGAVREFEAAVLVRPDDAVARHNLGVAFAGTGRLDDAVRELAAAARLAPDDATTHVDLALALERRGDVDGALRELDAALRLAPGDATAIAAMRRLRGGAR